MIDYTLIYSDRRSICASIKDGKLVVRAPRKTSQAVIDAFLNKHQKWIFKHIESEKNQAVSNAPG